MWHKRKASILNGALAGMAGGLAGSFTMNRFQDVLSRIHSGNGKRRNPQPARSNREQPSPSQNSGAEPATVKAAVAIAETLGRELDPEEKQPAANIVHYAFGTAAGGVYGAIAEDVPTARTGCGSLFGGVLWMLSDEVAVPLFGLSGRPQEYPASVHLSALASHLVYGITAEMVRRRLRAL